MTPYYDHDGITIYCGDAEVLTPQLPRCYATVSDPPYGIGEAGGKNKSRGKLAVSKDYGDESWDDRPPPDWMIQQIVDRSEVAILWGGNYFNLPPSSCWLVWDKDNGATDFADCELAWTNLPGAVRKIKWKWQGMLQERMGDKKEARVHPTQKPYHVMTWCLGMLPKQGVVFDPYCGSGTTLVAAKAAGLQAIGIEQSEAYCKEAVKRLRQGVLFPT